MTNLMVVVRIELSGTLLPPWGPGAPIFCLGGATVSKLVYILRSIGRMLKMRLYGRVNWHDKSNGGS
jgi:hypothetical protein